jgi:aspartate aminotransferase
LLLDAGDEVVFCEPGWFCYEPMLMAADAGPGKVPLAQPDFDLDLDAITTVLGPRTRRVIVNTPHNPTGRIYARELLEALAERLVQASTRFGKPIFLLSDEPYRRLRFDGRGFVSPAAVYPWTLIAYSYGKVLLAPGQPWVISPSRRACRRTNGRPCAMPCSPPRWRSAGAFPMRSCRTPCLTLTR